MLTVKSNDPKWKPWLQFSLAHSKDQSFLTPKKLENQWGWLELLYM